MLKPLLTSALLAFSILSAGTARAESEPPSGVIRGRIPIWGIGLSGGLTLRPYAYVDPPLFDGDSPRDGHSIKLIGDVGATASLTLDLGNMALTGAGSISVLKPMLLEGNGGIILGMRTWGPYTELISSTQTGPNTVTNTYAVYNDRWVPTVLGFYGGGGLLVIGDSTASTYKADHPVKGGTIATLEGGFGIAGRLGMVIAGAFDPVHSAWGGRLRMRAVFGGGDLAFHLGMNLFGVAGSSKDGLPVLQTTMDLGLGDGPGVFH